MRRLNYNVFSSADGREFFRNMPVGELFTFDEMFDPRDIRLWAAEHGLIAEACKSDPEVWLGPPVWKIVEALPPDAEIFSIAHLVCVRVNWVGIPEPESTILTGEFGDLLKTIIPSCTPETVAGPYFLFEKDVEKVVNWLTSRGFTRADDHVWKL